VSKELEKVVAEWPWLQSLGQLVCAAKDRDLSAADQERKVNEAHDALFNVLRSMSAPQAAGGGDAAVGYEVLLNGVWEHCSREEYESRKLACPHLRHNAQDFRALYTRPAPTGEWCDCDPLRCTGQWPSAKCRFKAVRDAGLPACAGDATPTWNGEDEPAITQNIEHRKLALRLMDRADVVQAAGNDRDLEILLRTAADAFAYPAAARPGEVTEAEIKVSAQGVSFGPNCWISHEQITGMSAAELNARKRIVAKNYMAWVDAALASPQQGSAG
jgi:hypothetical protein